MGQLICGAWRRRIDFDDRTLAHLRWALRAKMTEGKPFTLTWTQKTSNETKSGSIAIHPGTALEFRFRTPRSHLANQRWIRELLRPNPANTMTVCIEPPTAVPSIRDTPVSLPDPGNPSE